MISSSEFWLCRHSIPYPAKVQWFPSCMPVQSVLQGLMPFGHFRYIKEFSKTTPSLFNKKCSLQKSEQWFRLFISHNFGNFWCCCKLGTLLWSRPFAVLCYCSQSWCLIFQAQLIFTAHFDYKSFASNFIWFLKKCTNPKC